MRRFSFFLIALLTACGYGDVPEPRPGKGQLIVELKAYARHGLNAGNRKNYGFTPEAGTQFQKVNYSHLPDIAVWLEGESLKAQGPAPMQRELTVTEKGPDQRLVVLPVTAKLTLTNKTGRPLCLFCQAGSGGFDSELNGGTSETVRLGKSGVFEIYCDESEEFRVTLVVTPNSYAHQGVGGEYVYFDGLVPGDYTLCVKAARLPLWKEKVTLPSGQRTVVKSKLGVHQLSDSK